MDIARDEGGTHPLYLLWRTPLVYLFAPVPLKDLMNSPLLSLGPYPLVLSQLEYDEQADAALSPLPSWERARVRVKFSIKTMLTRY